MSFWEATTSRDQLNPLRENTSADTCIVGAGIAGLSIAYELIRSGQKVIVLDDGLIGRGMTGRTTAHLVNALDDRYYDLEKYHGQDGARMAAQSHSAAIDRIEKIVADEAIETLLPLAEERGVTIETTGDAAPTSGSHALLLQLTVPYFRKFP